jgi:hypothetical protein
MNHHDHLRTFVNHLRALNDPHNTAPLSDELLEPILALLMLDLEPLRPHLRKLYPALLLACPRRAGELYKQRSGIERINGSLKKALGERPFSSQGRLEVWTACWVMWRHARAWVHERFGKVKDHATST